MMMMMTMNGQHGGSNRTAPTGSTTTAAARSNNGGLLGGTSSGSSGSPCVDDNNNNLTEPLHYERDRDLEGEYNGGEDATNGNDWSPDKITLLLVLLFNIPSIIYIGYKMQIASIPYLILLYTSVPIAVKLQDHNGYVRWIAGFIFVAVLSGIKTAVLLSSPTDDSVAVKGIFYAYTALWECSNCVNIFWW